MQGDIKIFKGSGLNKDDDLDLIEGADSRNRDQIGFINGNYDVLTPRANPNITAVTGLPAGTNTLYGKVYYKELESYILFYYNSNGNHTIVKFSNNGTATILLTGYTTVTSGNYIDHIRIIGTGDEAMLLWVDSAGVPRSINISKLVSGYYTGLGFNAAYMTGLIKPAPTYKPTLTLSSDATVEYNRLTRSTYQFAYKYVYDTSQKSRASHWSDLIYDYDDEFVDGQRLSQQAVRNYILVTCTVGPVNVTAVELFYRKLDVGSGAPGFWQLISTIPYTGTGSVTYNFYGSEVGIVQTEEDFIALSDNVPYTTRSLEVIGGNRIALGGFNFGRDNITPSVTMTRVYAENGDTSFFVAGEVNYNATPAAGNDSFDLKMTQNVENHVIYECVTHDGSAIKARETHVLRSDYGISTGNYGSYKDNTPVINALVNIINTNTALSLTATRTIGGGNDDRLTIANGGADTLLSAIFATTATNKYRSLKENATHYFAIAYYDSANREGRCQISETMKLKATSVVTGNNYAVEMRSLAKYVVSHEAPSWATHWQFLYGGSSIPYYFYLLVSVPGPNKIFTTFDDSGPDVTISGNLMKINLSQAVTNVTNKFGYNTKTFEPAVGDYVKIRGTMSYGGTYVARFGLQDIYPIEKIDATSIYISGAERYMQATQYLLLEIFRDTGAIDEEDLYYYEVGDLLTITESSGHYYHNASTVTGYGVTAVNQSSGISAQGVINFGDCYQFPIYWGFKCFEVPPTANPEFYPVISRIESMSSSLVYDSQHNGKGRYNYVNKDETNKDYTAIICGGTFSDTSLKYNQLNRFTLGSEKYLNDKYGEINALVEMGDSLYCFQRSKLTPISVGGRRRVYQADGSYMTVYTDEVLGDDRPFDEDIGTIFPESICLHNRALYFWDSQRAALYRLAQDGLMDIVAGKFKMKSHFLIVAQNSTIYNRHPSFFDELTGCYVFYDNTYWFSFDPTIGKWQCTENYGNEGAICINGSRVWSFQSGNKYLHHAVTDGYAAGYVDVHFNDPKLMRKLWHSIEVDSEYLYSLSTNPSVWVDTDLADYTDTDTYTHTGGEMRSYIPNNNFKRVNGKYKAAFLRNNLNNVGGAGWSISIYIGDRLSGKHLTARLKNTAVGSNENHLRCVIVKYDTKR